MVHLELVLGNVFCSSFANILMKGAWHPFLIPLAFVLNSMSYCFLFLIYTRGENMIVAQTLISSSQIIVGFIGGVTIFEETYNKIHILAITFALSATSAMFIASSETRNMIG